MHLIKDTGDAFSEKEIEEKIENYELDSFLSSNIIQETEETRNRKQIGEVYDRNEELKKIEEDLMELKDLYNEVRLPFNLRKINLSFSHQAYVNIHINISR